MPDPTRVALPDTTIAPARDFVARAIDPARHKQVVLPAVGRFEVATAAAALVGANRVHADDTSLLSTLIGYAADPRHDLDELELEFPESLWRFMEGTRDEADHIAGTILMIKFLAIDQSSVFAATQRDEIWKQATDLRAALRDGIAKQLEILAGCTYEIAEPVPLVTWTAAAGDDVFFYVNAVGLRRRNPKLFGPAEERLWPGRPVWQGADRPHLAATLSQLSDADPLALAYVREQDIPDGWQRLAAFSQGSATEYVAGNRDTGNRLVKKQRRSQPATQWPVYADEEITADSVISFQTVDRDTCLHYRDLFVHRLGGTVVAERYCLMLVDGRVTTAFGLHLRDVVIGKTPYVGEIFGISVTSDRYARLGKMFMMALTSGDFKRWILHQYRMLQRCEPIGIQTPSPTKLHEGKTDRGVLTLVRREPRPGGGFQLLYRGEFRNDTWPEVMERWHAEQAWITRPGWTGPRLPEPQQSTKKRRNRGGASRKDTTDGQQAQQAEDQPAPAEAARGRGRRDRRPVDPAAGGKQAGD